MLFTNSNFGNKQTSRESALKVVGAKEQSPNLNYLSRDRTLQFWTSALVVLPVFLQAPWAHFEPFSASLFSIFILAAGVLIAMLGGEKWFQVGSLFIGVSGSWLGGSLFWGWLREYPVLHIPVEAVALPIAAIAIFTRWRIGAVFYLACLLGTALTDVMMVFTGVMKRWPEVVKASLQESPQILHQTALELFNLQSISLLFLAALLIGLLANEMRKRSISSDQESSVWLVASAALTTTLWVDGLFLATAFLEPRLSGLI